MVLTAEQHSQIAAVYDKAAADEMVPPPQRAAFARKADWFRMLARIGAKKEAAASSEAGPEKKRPKKARPKAASTDQASVR
jgi:hypothetical protein